MQPLSSQPPLVQVACLCAAWCGTCREYAPAYQSLANRCPDIAFAWVDVEAQADWLEDLDVENFPTLLIGVGGKPVFFGAMLPHVQTLERLLQRVHSLPAWSGESRPVLERLLTRLHPAV